MQKGWLPVYKRIAKQWSGELPPFFEVAPICVVVLCSPLVQMGVDDQVVGLIHVGKKTRKHEYIEDLQREDS